MEKIVLLDGNNLMFRSYYATSKSDLVMKNSKNFVTNALYGFVLMINKIIKEENYTHILVAFDKGKTFRHEMYDDYKGGRIETPDILKKQFPVAKEILKAMNITYLELDNYEADDIIGSMCKIVNNTTSFKATIISSDKDLLQLITDKVEVKLLKKDSYIKLNVDNFKDEFGITPIQIIDMKSLSGDSSDNIKGVKGIGDKTALKLIEKYGSIESIYQNIEDITGTVKEKLIAGYEDALTSKKLATIYNDIDLNIDMDYLIKKDFNIEELNKIYMDLEFFSFINMKDLNSEVTVEYIDNISQISFDKNYAFHLDLDSENYHVANIIGMSLYDGEYSYYIKRENLGEILPRLINNLTYTYDLKKAIVSLKKYNIKLSEKTLDIMIMLYLLNYNVKSDISSIALVFGTMIKSDADLLKKGFELKEVSINSINKAKFIYEIYNELSEKLVKEEMFNLFIDIENPLVYVLADMEYEGIKIDNEELDRIGESISSKLSLIETSIYEISEVKFNISSPKQVGEILFEKLNLPHGKKTKTGYSTNQDVLNKLIDKHPIINMLLEHRMLSKLLSTYVIGLRQSVLSDNKIHTMFNQTITRTGRLSSSEPNLQNIPIRNEFGRMLRKIFISNEDSILLSSDYSQIELRILAHLADNKEMLDAFANNIDIHTKTASEIFKVEIDDVTSEMRRRAKAVNFGIMYGISDYGLSEDLQISKKEANTFINNYLDTFPGIKVFMDKLISESYINGYSKTLFNRKRVIDELKSNNHMVRQMGERMALNTPIQGTSADIIKKAMIDIYQEFKKQNIKSKMILQIHDELVFNCINEELELVKNIVNDKMENACKLNVRLKVDINYGKNLYEAK